MPPSERRPTARSSRRRPPAAKTSSLERRSALRRARTDQIDPRDLQILSGTVAHELRNALTPALAVAQLLARRADLPDDMHRLLQRLTESVHRAVAVAGALNQIETLPRTEWPDGRLTMDLSMLLHPPMTQAPHDHGV